MSGERSDWYPSAVRPMRRMKTLGKYALGYPRGAVVHYTAGRDGADRQIAAGIDAGFAYLCIQKDGAVYQAHPISEWGSHAGASGWPELGEGRVSDELIGIEICCAGRVDKLEDGRFRTWWGSFLEKDEVRYCDGSDYRVAGFYERYTVAQERSLLHLLMWLKTQAPDVFQYDFVLGHEEVSPGRKQDPGASLSMAMPELRARLNDL